MLNCTFSSSSRFLLLMNVPKLLQERRRVQWNLLRRIRIIARSNNCIFFHRYGREKKPKKLSAIVCLNFARESSLPGNVRSLFVRRKTRTRLEYKNSKTAAKLKLLVGFKFKPRLGLQVLQGMYYTYFVSVITTIEKLFQIQSKTTGIIMSATEIGQIGSSLLLTYYGGQGHRPKWIAWGMILFAVSSFTCSMPHFIFGKQLIHQNEMFFSGIEGGDSTNLCKLQDQSENATLDR